MCIKFGTKVNNHGTIEKEKKKKIAETRNSLNANVNNPYPNEHLNSRQKLDDNLSLEGNSSKWQDNWEIS